MDRSRNDGSGKYPQNASDRALAPYALEAIGHQLDLQAPRLLSDESQAALDFLDLGYKAEGMIAIIFVK